MEYVLETSSLTKNYGSACVVNKVDMHVSAGDIYGFIGKNGAGKTSFMKMICGIAKSSSGDIRLFGNDNLTKQRRRIGCVIEEPALYPNMSARNNLLYYNKLIGIPKDDNIDFILNEVGLAQVGKKKISHFSLGMKQRLSIAVALIGNPDMLILDEPINGLDPEGIKEVRDLLTKLNRERHITILISSHILGELTKIATRYGIIDRGVMVEEFTAEELEERCKQSIRIKTNDAKKAAFILENNIGSRDYKITEDGTILVYDLLDNPARINKVLVDNQLEVSEITTTGEDLEGYFIDIMGGKSND